MTSITLLIEKFTDRKIYLSIVDGNLIIDKPADIVLEESELEILRGRKQELLGYLAPNQANVVSKISPVSRDQSLPLSFSQRKPAANSTTPPTQ